MVFLSGAHPAGEVGLQLLQTVELTLGGLQVQGGADLAAGVTDGVAGTEDVVPDPAGDVLEALDDLATVGGVDQDGQLLDLGLDLGGLGGELGSLAGGLLLRLEGVQGSLQALDLGGADEGGVLDADRTGDVRAAVLVLPDVGVADRVAATALRTGAGAGVRDLAGELPSEGLPCGRFGW
jgi:hypothetical protein